MRLIIEATDTGFIIRDNKWLTDTEQALGIQAPIVARFTTAYHCLLFCTAVNTGCIETTPVELGKSDATF